MDLGKILQNMETGLARTKMFISQRIFFNELIDYTEFQKNEICANFVITFKIRIDSKKYTYI